jgi:hypothetical protein
MLSLQCAKALQVKVRVEDLQGQQNNLQRLSWLPVLLDALRISLSRFVAFHTPRCASPDERGGHKSAPSTVAA